MNTPMMRFPLFLILVIVHGLALGETLTGRVVSITDGDTLVILDISNTRHKIRLQGIDAPEPGQAFGTKSKEHLADLVADKSVVIEYSNYGPDQLIPGKVLFNDQDMNLRQIEAGMAWHDMKYEGGLAAADLIAYSDAEREARRVRRGLWQEANPVAPWDYRQAKREQKKAVEAFEIRSETRDKPY
jgi:endonuclease YncB( thermonuclease family)